jgi:hypothetical protein
MLSRELLTDGTNLLPGRAAVQFDSLPAAAATDEQFRGLILVFAEDSP